MPRVSVLIPAFDAEAFLGDALASVARQTYRDLEVIVIDDGSSDRSAEVASRFPGVVVLRQDNRGPAAARNAGTARASGELLAFLDADDAWEPEKLSLCVERLDRGPAALLVATAQAAWEGRAEPSSLLEGEVTEALLLDNFVVTSTVLLRRGAFDAAGGFDPAFRIAEDWDLWLRLSLAGRFAALDRPLTRRRSRPGSASRDHLARDRAALGVLEKFAALPARPARCERAIARRRGRLHYLIGRALLAGGRPEEARGHLRQAKRGGPGDAWRARVLAPLAALPPGWLRAVHSLRERWRAARALH